ncbi:MAG: ATP synthase F1 subunit delta [Candidatus Cloacimonadota bacterium]|nr:MAG: ATP synthase F1 subunit delta [Candidatus Cloacimonadota bacterium]
MREVKLERNEVATRYSKAFVSLYKKEQLKDIKSQIIQLDKFLTSNPKIKKFLISPVVNFEYKKEIVRDITQSMELDNKITNFLFILIENNRIVYFDNIIEHIIALIHKGLNIFTVNLTLAHNLDKESIQNIVNIIRKQLSGEIIVQKKINPDIIGGFVAETGNISIDGSLKNSLEKIIESSYRRDIKSNLI